MSGCCRESSRMSGSGWEALKDVLEWLRGPPGCPEGSSGCPGVFRHPPVCPVVVRRPSRMSWSVQTPSSMSGSFREALPDVRECSDALQYVR